MSIDNMLNGKDSAMKAGLNEVSVKEVGTEIFDTDSASAIASKIMRAFSIGQLVHVKGWEAVVYRNGNKIIPMHNDIECCAYQIDKKRFAIKYPKGYLAFLVIQETLEPKGYEFKGQPQIINGELIFSIWRSR